MSDQATRLREIAQRFELRDRLSSPRVMVVTSGKGGVGKSTVALNLALTLGEAGQKVLLVDADTNLGSIDIMLGVSPRFRMGEVLRGEADLEDVLFTPAKNLRVLPASSGDAEHPDLTEGDVDRMFADIATLHERPTVVLVDTGAGMHREVMAYCMKADELLVVAGPEPTSVMDAYAMMKVVWAERPEASLSLVLNNVRTSAEAEEVGGKLSQAVRHFLKRELVILGAVPADQSVQRAVLQQLPLVKAFPRSPASLAFRSLASQVSMDVQRNIERRVMSL